LRIRARSSKGTDLRNAPVFLLVVFLVAFTFYLLLLHLRVEATAPLIASLGPSSEGFFFGPFSLGYLSSLTFTVLGISSLIARRRGAPTISWQGLGAGTAVGLLVGGSFTLIPAVQPSSDWLHAVKDTEGGFTLVVNYNSTTLTLGRNLTMQYVLTDDSYQLTTPYHLFGGQFSMVYYDSTGRQVVAFRAPITFNRAATQYSVELQAGERWTTLLSWDGTIIPLNGTGYMAGAGRYTLASYAVLQDANVSLYVVLHTPDIPVNIVRG
jgi:hypothetical protein